MLPAAAACSSVLNVWTRSETDVQPVRGLPARDYELPRSRGHPSYLTYCARMASDVCTSCLNDRSGGRAGSLHLGQHVVEQSFELRRT